MNEIDIDQALVPPLAMFKPALIMMTAVQITPRTMYKIAPR